jgi:hypothetical protein
VAAVPVVVIALGLLLTLLGVAHAGDRLYPDQHWWWVEDERVGPGLIGLGLLLVVVGIVIA